MIASQLIIEAGEQFHKRPTQLKFEELIDVVQAVVKNCSMPDVKVRYLLIEWVNGNPIIDGCKHFDSKDDCLKYWREIPKVMDVEYTICETNAP